MKHVTRKRIFIGIGLIVLIIVGLNFVKIYKSEGGRSLLFHTNYIKNTFLYENHFDLVEMLGNTIAFHQNNYMVPIWGDDARIKIEPNECPSDDFIDWNNRKSFPEIIFYLGGREDQLIVTCVQINQKAFEAVTGIKSRRGEREASFANDSFFATYISQEGQYSREEHEEVKKVFDLAYSFEEMQTLKSFSVAFQLCQALMTATIRFRGMEEECTYEFKTLRSYQHAASKDWMIVYGLNCSDEHELRLYWEVIKDKAYLVFILLLIIFFLIHFLRKDLRQILTEELDQLGVSLNRKIFWRLLLSNWRFLLIPAKDEKVRPIIRKVCREIKDHQVDKSLALRVNQAWREITGLIDSEDPRYPGLLHSYQIASGESRRKKNLVTREIHLRLLQKGLRGIESSQNKTKLRPKKYVSQPDAKISKAKAGTHVSRKDRLLAEISEDLPREVREEISAWTTNNLRCLEVALMDLPSIHPEALDLLLDHTGKQDLLKKESRFMEAIRAGDRKIVCQILGCESGKKKTAHTAPRINYAETLSGKKILIVGAGKSEGKSRILCEATLEMGAVECSFVSTDNKRKVERATKSGSIDIIVVVASRTSHNSIEVLDSSQGRVVEVRSINVRRFQEEIAIALNKD